MNDYQKGFDDGYAYLVAFIEQWIDSNEYDPRSVYPVKRLLEELKQQEENL